MRFIHCSDIHLGRRPVGGIGEYSEKRYQDYFRAFRQIIDRAVQENVDALLIAGDLFDRRELSPEILARTEKELELLLEKSIQVIAIEGNHDNITPGKEHESWLIYLEQKGLLKRPFYSVNRSDETDQLQYCFTPVIVKGEEVYGLGYPGGMVSDVVHAFYEFLEENDKKKVVALIHTAPAGGDFLPGVIPHEEIEKLQERVLYLACGHFHSYSIYPDTSPFLYIPGSSEYWDLGEKNGMKGMILFDSELEEHQFFETSPRSKIICSIEAEQDSNIYELFKNKISELNIVDGEEILIIEIIDSFGNSVDTARLQKIALEICSPLKTEIVIKRNSGESNTDKRRNEGESVDSVERRIIQGWDLFANHYDAVHRTLSGLKETLYTNDQPLFRHSFDELLNHIIDSENEQCN